MNALFNFNGGVHPPQHKEESNHLPIAIAPLPKRLIVPLRQHLGEPAQALVSPGAQVLKGQMIGKAGGYVSAAIHAPTSGTVMAVENHVVAHPSGLPDICVVIESDGEDRWVERHPIDYRNLDPAIIRERLRDAGVVGLGGAVFPTYVKLDPGQARKIDTLVINGAECEPWITADDLTMRERAGEIIEGVKILAHLMLPAAVLIGIEDNKPEAIAAMSAACAGTPFKVVAVPTIYPGGGEKQLIKVLTGKEVPSGQRPIHIGVTCSNIGTAYTVHRAVNHGEAVISRVVTVTGSVARPQNFEVLIGTPLCELLALAGGATPDTRRYIIGGPMMGFDLGDLGAPLVKSINCIIAAAPSLFPPAPPAAPCIRCGQCARACPADLQPQELFWFAQSRNLEKARAYHIFDCIECGCCNYVCPSAIPLVSFYRYAKSAILATDREQRAAEIAKERYQFKQERVEREKRERAAMLAKKQAAAKAAAAADPDAEAKKAAIQAALARVKGGQTALQESEKT